MGFGELWWALVGFHGLCCALVKFGGLWWAFVGFGRLLWTIIGFGEFWGAAMNFGGLWWALVAPPQPAPIPSLLSANAGPVGINVFFYISPPCKTNLLKYECTYRCVQTCANVYRRVRTICWVIFDRTDMKISLYLVVFRIEFDGDVRFA